jgi:acyl-CoA synthetase (AMP-forming)/AMP-acid ligase II
MPWFQEPRPLLPDLIAQNGRWLADRPALIDGACSLSWREFADATARVANGLASLGIQPGDRVAVLMDSRHETVLTLFGIVRAGAVAVPLNISINDAAEAAMCADACCVAVFASGHHCARIDALRASGALAARHFIGCDPPGEG